MNWSTKPSPAPFPQRSKTPIVPAVYRPEKVAQQKATVSFPPASRAHHLPVTPPVYRPGPASTVPLLPAYRPQPTPQALQRKGAAGAPLTNHLSIQRYSTPTIAELGGSGKLSQTGNYFLPDRHPRGYLIYVKTDAAAPLNSSAHQSPVTVGLQMYRVYKPSKRQFYRDCLHTAEEIIKGQKLRYKAGGDYSQFAGTDKIVGESHKKNISRASKNPKGDTASPSLGQAYLIVNTKWPGGVGSPYHAAAVVAVDGSDRVTLEVFATEETPTSRTLSGKYEIYSVAVGSGDTFHSHWQNNFFGADSVTTVIEPR